ncbi:hypothetical protein GPY51_13660 [Photorhabdus laumondii subsp. laumondii]|uniref:Photorhabdus luminescens subsp. laumondii TTO1 complete genome segment 11/17 n=2 Tax=Photorhabdus laumondii subsp. laumondii TaxID=141679 RepID=Q7N2P3_PHOLL|nr:MULTISPECIES: hypothetical protein [Photorhabdus]AWK42734.1 hypothetical protein A4R40_15145 [Photorhabdus laumondii subsp. laumondii]AXG43508.1 hypothetical protein PluDJC_15495 [Photorhabdus laumondii subsp. laumondii]AXG48052.1 hypothetical protein PluTT01m_15600 [Photorhabdus laumondii subsp. laumondii]KTL59782.1 hypothetical protein AA106_15600 [Photorhabdus laumondii subsp. laumondii]MCC8382576.1 hypothetical protein [Photorhabdus laumondii]
MSNDVETTKDFLISLRFDVDEVEQRKFMAVITEVTSGILKMRAEIENATSVVASFITQIADGLDKLYGKLQETDAVVEKVKSINEESVRRAVGGVERFLPSINAQSHDTNGRHFNTASLVASMNEQLLKATTDCANQNTSILDSDDIFNAIEELVKWLDKGEISAKGLLATLNELWKFTGRKIVLGVLFDFNSRLNALQEEAKKNHETVAETLSRRKREYDKNKKPLITYDQLDNWMSTHGIYLASDLTPFFSKDKYEKYQEQIDGKKTIIHKQYSQKVADISSKVSERSSKTKKKRKTKRLNKDHLKTGIVEHHDAPKELNTPVNQPTNIFNSELTAAKLKKLKSSRGVRNNNPLNMNFVHQTGAVLEDNPKPRFAQYPDAYSGLRATAHQLTRYFRGKTTGKKLQTIASIVPTWAPKKDHNKTKQYIANVSKMMGVSKDTFLDLTDPDVMQRLIDSMMIEESGGNPYSPEFIRKAIMAELQPANKAPKQAGHLNHVAHSLQNISIDHRMINGAVTNINGMMNHQGLTPFLLHRAPISAGNNIPGIGEVNYHIEVNGVESPREAARLTGETVERTHSMLLRNMQTQVK